jgi:chromosome segregation ATPase
LQGYLDEAKSLLALPEGDSLSIAAQLKSLQSQYSEIDMIIPPVSPDMEKLQSEWIEKLCQVEDERTSYQSQIAALESGEAHTTLMTQVVSLKEERKVLETRLEESLDSRIAMESDNQDYQETIEVMTSAASDRNADIALLTAEKNALETELASRRTDENLAPGLKQLLEKANGEIGDLKRQLDSSIVNAGDATRGEKKARRESDFADSQKNSLRKKVAELEEENRVVGVDCVRLNEEVKELQGRVSIDCIQLTAVNEEVGFLISLICRNMIWIRGLRLLKRRMKIWLLGIRSWASKSKHLSNLSVFWRIVFISLLSNVSVSHKVLCLFNI